MKKISYFLYMIFYYTYYEKKMLSIWEKICAFSTPFMHIRKLISTALCSQCHAHAVSPFSPLLYLSSVSGVYCFNPSSTYCEKKGQQQQSIPFWTHCSQLYVDNVKYWIHVQLNVYSLTIGICRKSVNCIHSLLSWEIFILY